MSPTLPCVLRAILGVVCGWIWPWHLGPTRYVQFAGILVAVVVGVSTRSLLRSFRKHRTSADPKKAVDAIVDTGLYRYSRNPGYVAAGALQAVVGLFLNNAWVLLFILPAMAVIHRVVVLSEEAYLEELFGQEYLSYKARVRRWL